MQSKITFLCLLFVSLNDLSFGQNLELDSLFTDWSVENNPGGSVVILQQNKVLYSGSFGIENQRPIDEKTIFNTGSIAKQFTALGILILEKQGVLNLDDPIEKYIPQFSNYAYTITIRHLLNHTSGLRDFHGLLAIGGWKTNQIETQEDILSVLSMQKELNFIPGNEFFYSNSNYILLSEIISSASGISYPALIDELIQLALARHRETQQNRVNR